MTNNNNNNNIGTDHHQSRHTQQQTPREAEQVLQTCRHSPPHSINVNKYVYDKNLKGRTPEEGGKTEEEFEIFRREFMKDIVSSLNNDLGDGVATLTIDSDTGFYNIKLDGTISQLKLPVNGAHPFNSTLPSNNTSHCAKQMSQFTTSPTSQTAKSNIEHSKTVKERTPEEGGTKISGYQEDGAQLTNIPSRQMPTTNMTNTEFLDALSVHMNTFVDDIKANINAHCDKIRAQIQEIAESFEKTNKISTFLDKQYNHAATCYFNDETFCVENYKRYSKFRNKLFRKALSYRRASDSSKIKKLLLIQQCAQKFKKEMDTLLTTRRSNMHYYNASLLRVLQKFCSSSTFNSLQLDEKYRIDLKMDSIRIRFRRQLEQTFETPWWASAFHESNAELLKLVAETLTMLGHSNQDIEKTTPTVVSKSFSPTTKQIKSIQHFDFASIPGHSFTLPSELCVIHQTNYTQTRQSTFLSYSKWLLNSDGWMMIHDLKGWKKVHFLKGWLKCLSCSVKYLFHDVIGSMKLHDLTGWLKTSSLHTTMCTIELL